MKLTTQLKKHEMKLINNTINTQQLNVWLPSTVPNDSNRQTETPNQSPTFAIHLRSQTRQLITNLEEEIQNFIVEIRDSSKIVRMFLLDSYNSLEVNVSHTSKI